MGKIRIKFVQRGFRKSFRAPWNKSTDRLEAFYLLSYLFSDET